MVRLQHLFRLKLLAAAVCLAFLIAALPARGSTVTLDFDAPDFTVGDTIPRIGDVNFLPSGIVFAPSHVPTFSGTQALKVPSVCASVLCPNQAYQMEIRFGSGPPSQIPNGPWIWRAADTVSVRVGADSVALSCFPEGTTCPMYARLRGWNKDNIPVADSNDVFLFDASSLATGAYSAPITREISIHDPFASIVRVTLVYGHDTHHDNGFPGEPQIDHLVVNFPDSPPNGVPLPRVPTIQITAPLNGAQPAFPYQVRLKGSVTTYAGIGAFCITENVPLPNYTDCHDYADIQPGNTFDVLIPDGALRPGQNTLTATVFDQMGQRGTASVNITPAQPPPPAIQLYSPSANQWVDPSHNLAASGTVQTVGVLKGFCIVLDVAAPPTSGQCTQDLGTLQPANAAWQPLFFSKSLTSGQVTTGQHLLSVFAFDRWDQRAEADVTFSTPTDFRIVGMEITQGVQTLDIPLNNSGSGVAQYAGVNLWAGIPTVVRVFANTPFAGAYSGVGMMLEGFVPSGAGEMSLGGLLPDSSPPLLVAGPLSVPPSVRADPAGAYVFTLPDNWTQQNGLRLKATLTPPFGAQECSICASNNVFSVVGINFGGPGGVTVATVALTFVDSAGTFNSPPAPSTVFADVFNLSPVPPGSATAKPYAGTIDVSDLVGPVGSDGTAACRMWTTICQARIYSRMRLWESQNPQAFNWVGVGPIDIGWTNQPIAIANSQEPLLAVGHEYYHDLNYYHASSSCGADVYVDWPPDGKGYIQGVGLDRRKKLDASGNWNGQYTIYMAGSPYMPGSVGDGQVYDLMAYCAHNGVTWISTHNWNAFGSLFPNGLFPYLDAFSGTIMGGTGSAPAASDDATLTGELIEATALLELDGRAEFLSVVPVRGKARQLRQAFTNKDYAFVARDAQGKVLARVAATLQLDTGHHSDEPEPRVVLSAHVPARGTALVDIEYKGRVIGQRRRSKSAPEIHISSVGKGRPISRAEALDIKWTAKDKDADPLEVRIEFSPGSEMPFRPVFIGPNRGTWRVPGRILSATDHGRVRIVVNDGFNESEQIAAPIIIHAAAPIVDVLSPASGSSFPETTPIRLLATAFGDGDAPLVGDAIQWSVDGQAVGTGLETEVRGLKPGEHVATVVAREGELSNRKQLTFTVRSSGKRGQ
jgi:hypothetical protein